MSPSQGNGAGVTESGARSCLECSGKLPSTQLPAAPSSLKAQISQLGANKEQAEQIHQAEALLGKEVLSY